MVFLAREGSSQITLLPHSLTSEHSERCSQSPTESSQDKVVKGQTGHLSFHGWGYTGLLRSCLCLSYLINSEITVKFLFPSFLLVLPSVRTARDLLS